MENTDLNFKDCFDRDVFKVYTENGSKSIALMYYVYQEGQKYPQVVWPERVTTLPVPVKENDVLDTWEAARQAQASLEEKHPEMKEEESAGYPYLYGFVSSGCSGTARRIKAVIEELKNEMGWKE